MNQLSELDWLLGNHTWRKCPSVTRDNVWFYYRRDANYIAHRVMFDVYSGHWFYHVSIN